MKINNNQFHNYGLVPKSAAGYLHIAAANDMKVLLYLATAESGELEPKVLEHLGLTEDEFRASVKFWTERSVLPKDILASPVRQADQPDITQMPQYNLINISIEVESNRKLRELIQSAETLLARTMTASDISTIYGMFDWLKLPPQVILSLMQYCVSIGKKNIKYMEKMAIDWSKNGIRTQKQAEEYLSGLQQKQDFSHHIKELFQISGRELTPKERSFAAQWKEYGFHDDMLLLAYEKTVANTGKVAFAYLNTILKSWYDQGYGKPEDTLKDKSAARAGAGSTRFNYEEYERKSYEIIKDQNGGEG